MKILLTYIHPMRNFLTYTLKDGTEIEKEEGTIYREKTSTFIGFRLHLAE